MVYKSVGYAITVQYVGYWTKSTGPEKGAAMSVKKIDQR